MSLELYVTILLISESSSVSGAAAYETTALMREFAETVAESAKWNKRSPNIIITK